MNMVIVVVRFSATQFVINVDEILTNPFTQRETYCVLVASSLSFHLISGNKWYS